MIAIEKLKLKNHIDTSLFGVDLTKIYIFLSWNFFIVPLEILKDSISELIIFFSYIISFPNKILE